MGILKALKPVGQLATVALVDLGNAATPAATPANKERTVTVRAANVGAADAFVDLYLVDTVTGANSHYRAKNYPVPYQAAGSAPDLESSLVIPAGFKLQVQASAANAVAVSLTGYERDAEA